MSERRSAAARAKSLADLKPGTTAVVGELGFDESDAVRLMELGFIPGMSVSCRRRVPMGDLSIYDLDGSQIALRRETASRIRVRSDFATGVEHAKRD
jgi:Fe2+ transport system protein FeoA